MSKVPLVLIVAVLGLLAESGSCLANHAMTQPDETARDGALNLDGLSVWLHTRFSESELDGLQPGDLKVESYFCGCYDKPNKHFPYAIALLKTSKGDLVARPESMEGSVTFTPLAVRRGNQYCEVESEEQCYGSFMHPCEFTDFRYGPHLVAFFPTCKTE